jgi:hypothetical protein
MADHFRERTAAWKKALDIHADYQKRFYSPECDWHRWKWTALGGEAERILTAVPVDAGFQVSTDGFHVFQLRYNLRPAGKSWMIWDVDLECGACYLRGRRDGCFLCGGTGWRVRKDQGGDISDESSGEDPPSENPRWKS